MRVLIFKDPGLVKEDIQPMLVEDLFQLEQWGTQKRSPFEWVNYLVEEVGELAAAISEHVYRDGSREDISKEAIQAATLALKISKMANDIF